MDKDTRRRMLQEAALRQKLRETGERRCRLCGGRCVRRGPYCTRHFYAFRGYSELAHAVKEGRRLDEADALCLLKTVCPALRFNEGTFMLWMNVTARSSGCNEWIVRHQYENGREVEIARFNTVNKLYEWARAQQEIFSSHNRYASKTLIR